MQANNYEFQYGNQDWSDNLDVFTSEVKKNPVSRIFTIVCVGFGWVDTYKHLTFIVDNQNKHLFSATDKKAFDEEVKKQLARINSGKIISKFEGLGIFKTYQNCVEEYVKKLATEQNKKWCIVVDDIRSAKLRAFLAKNGYSVFRKNCMRKFILIKFLYLVYKLRNLQENNQGY